MIFRKNENSHIFILFIDGLIPLVLDSMADIMEHHSQYRINHTSHHSQGPADWTMPDVQVGHVHIDVIFVPEKTEFLAGISGESHAVDHDRSWENSEKIRGKRRENNGRNFFEISKNNFVYRINEKPDLIWILVCFLSLLEHSKILDFSLKVFF